MPPTLTHESRCGKWICFPCHAVQPCRVCLLPFWALFTFPNTFSTEHPFNSPAGTRFILPGGKDMSVLKMVLAAGGQQTGGGMIRTRAIGPKMPFR